ncbi:hypothetical protein GCM10009599_04200 [Luteococcus peritonei]
MAPLLTCCETWAEAWALALSVLRAAAGVLAAAELLVGAVAAPVDDGLLAGVAAPVATLLVAGLAVPAAEEEVLGLVLLPGAWLAQPVAARTATTARADRRRFMADLRGVVGPGQSVSSVGATACWHAARRLVGGRLKVC